MSKHTQDEVATSTTLSTGLVEEKVGYKQTKLGLIPEDWIYSSIKNYVNQLNGFAFKSNEFNLENRGTRLCRGINITRGNLRFDEKNEMFWENSNNLNLAKYLLEDGDIVISMDGSLVGRNYSIVGKEFLPLLLVQRVARIRTLITMSQSFLFHWVSSNNFIRYVDSIKTSSGIPHISAKDINNFTIAVPPLPEQQKIASILNTWDKAIVAQEKLITQKQALKKGLMQQLLTGKKRFPGFDEKWNVKSLDELGVFSRGKGIAKKDILENGFDGLPSVRYAEIYTKYNYSTYSFISKINPDSAKSSNPIKYGDILFAGSGEKLEDIGKSIVYLGLETAYAGGDIIILKQYNQDSRYLGYLLNSDLVKKQFFQIGQGHSVVHIYSSGLKKVLIPLPLLSEQQKISNILDNCTKEILQLKIKLEQLKNQKKGLMQQLLTGEKRIKI
ncbi:restriction endonuclease subunit S [Gillisia hiemivivida]|uniref:Type I restriction modification DNA specificity domain-containing protein n=1 Tax=Gillisia hiemivivida TaxID=291190 RepID=A0A5C6ZYI6_9FLAO|nr:restriction endonuclease subunit S [Gillisia hiemivivida]TXD95484.1 hypothetical protein ES724_00165 [Gillisia hiemivivida]